MATCPNCGTFLDANHQCRGLWRLRLRYWANVFFGGLCGGVIAFVTLTVMDEHISMLAVGIATVLGMVIASAFLRGSP